MTIGEVFLSAFLQVMFEKLLSTSAPVVHKFLKQVKGIKPRTIKELETQLRCVEAVLIDAEHRQIHSRAVNRWLKHLQDLFYDPEDLLDEIAAEVMLHQLEKDPQLKMREESHSQHITGSTISKVGSTVKRLIPKLKHRLDVSRRVNDISECLQDLLRQTDVFNSQ